MSAVQVNSRTGLPDLVYSAHLVPSTAEKLETGAQSLPYEFLEPDIPSQLDTNFVRLTNLGVPAQERGNARETDTAETKVQESKLRTRFPV